MSFLILHRLHNLWPILVNAVYVKHFKYLLRNRSPCNAFPIQYIQWLTHSPYASQSTYCASHSSMIIFYILSIDALHISYLRFIHTISGIQFLILFKPNSSHKPQGPVWIQSILFKEPWKCILLHNTPPSSLASDQTCILESDILNNVNPFAA